MWNQKQKNRVLGQTVGERRISVGRNLQLRKTNFIFPAVYEFMYAASGSSGI